MLNRQVSTHQLAAGGFRCPGTRVTIRRTHPLPAWRYWAHGTAEWVTASDFSKGWRESRGICL